MKKPSEMLSSNLVKPGATTDGCVQGDCLRIWPDRSWKVTRLELDVVVSEDRGLQNDPYLMILNGKTHVEKGVLQSLKTPHGGAV